MFLNFNILVHILDFIIIIINLCIVLPEFPIFNFIYTYMFLFYFFVIYLFIVQRFRAFKDLRYIK